MSNDIKAIDRLYKLQAKINMMVVDGTRDAESVADTLQQILEEKPDFSYVQDTMSLTMSLVPYTIAKAHNIYTGYLDPNFKDWGTDVRVYVRVYEDSIEIINVDVRTVTRDGEYKNLFGYDELKNICLTQRQINQFVVSNRNLLSEEDYGLFFIFEQMNEFFVAEISMRDGLIAARLRRYNDSHVWKASGGILLVVKQTTG